MASAARLINYRNCCCNYLSTTSINKLHKTSPTWRCLSSYTRTVRLDPSSTTSSHDHYTPRSSIYNVNKNSLGLGSAWKNNGAYLQTASKTVGIRFKSTYDLDSGPVGDMVSHSNEASSTVGADLAFGESAQGAVIDVAQTTAGGDYISSSIGVTSLPTLETESAATIGADLAFSDIAQVAVPDVAVEKVQSAIADGDHFSSSIGVNTLPTLDTESAATIGADLAFSDTAQVAVPDVAVENFQSSIDAIEYIPAPPIPIDLPAAELTSLGEATLQSVGLASWWPSGWMQWMVENIHVGLELPWWGAIALATVGIRCCLFPLVIKAQKNGAKMANHMPQMQVLQMKITEARNSGNQMEVARLTHELGAFYKEKDISIAKTVMVPLAQAPIFMSMFFGLRGMANLPVESMKTGGMFWFEDLTVMDPYFALPIITSLTLLASIELGVDGTKLGAQSANVKLFLRALPVVMLPFTYSFPTAVLCYWVTTNSFSLVQVGLLKIPKVREYFQIPKTITHKPGTLPPKKGVIEGFKDSWANQKIVKEIEERAHFDEMRFKRAGQGPIIKTYKHNPTTRKKNVIDVKPKLRK